MATSDSGTVPLSDFEITHNKEPWTRTIMAILSMLMFSWDQLKCMWSIIACGDPGKLVTNVNFQWCCEFKTLILQSSCKIQVHSGSINNGTVEINQLQAVLSYNAWRTFGSVYNGQVYNGGLRIVVDKSVMYSGPMCIFGQNRCITTQFIWCDG